MSAKSIGDERTLPSESRGEKGYSLNAGDTLGQYRVIRALGKGGMGEVYEVEHEVLGGRFALKLLPANLEWKMSLERFKNEARVMFQLDHSKIVKVDEFGETDGRYWLRMEIVGGVTNDEGRVTNLQDYADARGGRIPPVELAGILLQICEGLAYAHGKGVIHRDLKPANILVEVQGSGFKVQGMGGQKHNVESGTLNGDEGGTRNFEPKIKIADFGLVRLVGEAWVKNRVEESVRMSMSLGEVVTMADGSSEGSSTKSLLGTFEYMSPEQKRGEEVDERSDVYSLGMMAFRLLTGRNPGLKLPSKLVEGLDPAWDDLLSRALEEDREVRIGDAEEFQKRLPEGDALIREEKHTPKHRKNVREPSLFVKEQAPVPEVKEAIVSVNVDIKDWKPTNTLGIEMVYVEPGKFLMGSNDGRDNEKPVGEVRITKPFWMGKTPVTQGQYERITGYNPSFYQVKGFLGFGRKKALPDHPVEQVTWKQAFEFCLRLTELEKSEGRLPVGYVYRLPTEAEWEYAARGGEKSQGFIYAGSNDASEAAWYGWFGGNSSSATHSVGKKKENELGLYDMSGNVYEWVQDWYQDNHINLDNFDPTGPSKGVGRVIRGGSWGASQSGCRVACRLSVRPKTRYSSLGFRVALGPRLT